MLIRPARDEDIGAIVRAYDWLFEAPGSVPPRWDPSHAAERLRAAIESPGAEVLVADVDGRVAGICTIYDDIDSVRFGRRAWVEDLAVDPAERSRGVGKALMDAAKDWAREHGASHLELDSAEARVDAHRFYEREGAAYRSISFGWDL
jgi:GNAT superfamily N-acetyltransferase